ncbi:unnamed protein product [Hydatigera taeniaeformis]|uniref:DUF3342 domain-containing protein n=1 Tax=Hydatigena taeniaeformis TaxID=6205 RepID=A0A0R3WUW4_HYDTA|nr:unnamed protein product [Hydatigera taeniaeformis]
MRAEMSLAIEINPDSEISIHVHDAANGALLEKEMLFFQQYFHETQQSNYYYITICSDIQTFKWLLTYMKSKNDRKLDVSNILPVLVSAEFLQMPELVASCIAFLCDRVTEIPSLIADIDMVRPPTWEKIARHFMPGKLSSLTDDFLPFKKYMNNLR